MAFESSYEKSFNFIPINKWPKNKKVFDIISFVIFCPKHRKIEIIRNESEKDITLGFPFIYLSSYIKIDDLIDDTLCLILSGGDSELMAKYKEVLPFDTNVSHVLSLRLRQFKFGFTRFTCFVRIHSKNHGLECCLSIPTLAWYNMISRNYYFRDFWEPEATKFIRKFNEYMKSIRNENEVIQDLYPHHMPLSAIYYSKSKQIEYNLDVLKTLNISEKDIQLFFMEFIEHCFPSVYMSFISYKLFLNNLGLTIPDGLMKLLFIIIDNQDFLSFEELLTALICLDPHCPDINTRFKLKFKYYSTYMSALRNAYLIEKNLFAMVSDTHSHESEEVIKTIVTDYMALKNPSSEGLTYNDFEKGVISGTIEGTDRLFRLKFPLFRRIGCGRKRVGPNVCLKNKGFDIF